MAWKPWTEGEDSFREQSDRPREWGDWEGQASCEENLAWWCTMRKCEHWCTWSTVRRWLSCEWRALEGSLRPLPSLGGSKL